MKRKLFIIASVLTAALLLVTPALAITFGEEDNGKHPNIGTMVPITPYPYIPTICTGTLISPTVFLTAAHCIVGMQAMFGITPMDTYVTFDTDIAEGSKIYEVLSYRIDPNYNHTASDPHDLAVLVLEPVADITPATLPPANMLDEMQSAGELKDQQFVVVGYGTVRDDKTGAPPVLFLDGIRRYTTGTFNALTSSWLKISANPATGDGGTCRGDSGSPYFLGDSNMIVSVTSGGDAACRAMDWTYRLDTESARSFLKDYVILP